MANLITNFMTTLEYILPFLIVLTVLVFFHELGHYFVARWNGVKIEVFSIGFGPELFGWTDKNGTRWKVSLLPLGGYVKMYGDADPSGQAVNPELVKMTPEQKALTIHSKTPLQRIAVSAAGPIANYLLAIVLLMGLFFIKGEPHPTNEMGVIMKSSVAEQIGIKVQDKIVRINDHKVEEFKDLSVALKGLQGKDIEVEVLRPVGNAQEVLILKGKMIVMSGNQDQATPIPSDKLGVLPGGSVFKPVGMIRSFTASIGTCYDLSVGMLKGIKDIIMGKASGDNLGGVISIGHQAKQFANRGVADLILFMALISVNLGLINLFPIPVVDGGHILLCSIEAIRGKPISEKVQEKAFLVGLFLVLSLMLYTTWNDLVRHNVFDWFLGFFR